MDGRYRAAHHAPADYANSQPELPVMLCDDPRAKVIVGTAIRVGCTPPWEQSRAVYELRVGPFIDRGREAIPGLYVLDADPADPQRFVSLSEWRAADQP